MIRIDTIEDLVRVLDDHPDWREAVWARLLSRELLDLPSRFSDFVEETRAFHEEMTKFVAETKAFREEMTTFVAETKAFKAEMHDFVAATNRQFKSIRDDLGVLKGAHARNAAERNLGLIARSMGLWRRRVLDGEQLFDLAREAGADTGDGAVESYLQADLVFEAEDDRGATVLCDPGGVLHGERPGHGPGDAQRRAGRPLHRVRLPRGRGEPAGRRSDRRAGRIRPGRVVSPAAQGAGSRLIRTGRRHAGAGERRMPPSASCCRCGRWRSSRPSADHSGS